MNLKLSMNFHLYVIDFLFLRSFLKGTLNVIYFSEFSPKQSKLPYYLKLFASSLVMVVICRTIMKYDLDFFKWIKFNFKNLMTKIYLFTTKSTIISHFVIIFVSVISTKFFVAYIANFLIFMILIFFFSRFYQFCFCS